MNARWSRWLRRGQNAAGATADGDITLISHVQGNVTVVSAAVPPQAGTPDTESAYAAYARCVRQRYGRLDLEVLTPLREQGEHPVVPLREVFVPQSVRADPPPVELPPELLRRLMDPAEAELHELPPGVDRETVERVRRAYQERPPQPVLDVLTAAGHGHLVLLGDPGAGKSTLARYLALALTAPEPPPGLEPLRDRVPLIVELRSYAQAAWREQSFENFLGHQHATEGLGLPPGLLADLLAGQGPRTALVIFDGLDELFEKDIRDAVTRRIAGFAARHPRARILVTSRGYGYRRAVLDGAGFANFMLQALDRAQIGAFTEQWFAVACPEDPEGGRRMVARVSSAVDGSPSVRELAGNPLILTILAIIGRRRELPRDRRTVYEHAVDVLVEHWDPSKYLKDRRVEEHLPYLAAEDKRELLRLIARRMQEGHGGVAGNHIAGPDLVQHFEDYLKDRYALPPDRAATAARIMLDQFRHRNFVLSRYGGEIYGFVHRAFLEYLTATDLAHRFHHTRELTEQDLQDLFEAKVADPAWQEILLLLVGMLDERFVAGVIDRLLAPRRVAVPLTAQGDRAFTEVAFVARALAEVRRLGVLAPQSAALVRRITSLFEQAELLGQGFLYPYDKAGTLSSSLAALGGNWSGWDEYATWYDRRPVHDEQREADRTLSVNRIGQLAADILVSRSEGEGHRLRAETAETVLRSPHREVRYRMLVRILSVLGERPELLGVFERRLRAEPSPAVRAALIPSLVRGPRAEEDWAIRLAVECLTREADAWVRGDSMRRLPTAVTRVPELRAVLEQALDDPSPGVGRLAFDRLARDPDRERSMALRRSALAQEDAELRVRAFRGVREGGGDDDHGLRTLAEDTVRDEAHARVVAAALDTFGARALDVPRLRELVLSCCGHADAEVRRTALRCLTRTTSPDEDMVARSAHLLDHDPDRGVRRAALSTIAALKGDAAREFLAERSRSAPQPEARLDAINELAMSGSGIGLELVGERLRAEADESVRTGLAHALLAWSDVRNPDRAEEARIALDLVRNDPSAQVRAAAFDRLAECHDDVPALLALAEDRYAHDTDEDLRSAAFGLMADIRRDDPELLPVLRHAAARDTGRIATRAVRLLGHLAPEGRPDPT
ncbi:NACHT domain-containing protein [Streptomyces sp. NPDC101191]|uniref:NACHT domain-containing protein n=1 Tax=Streptomyces sp. NPDC101191 TaxID=3366126 RepID=UPI0037FBF149